MSAIASQITSLTIVYSTVYPGADQSKHQSSASLAFVWGIHRGPVISPHKWPVTRTMFPFDDVIMYEHCHDYQDKARQNLVFKIAALFLSTSMLKAGRYWQIVAAGDFNFAQCNHDKNQTLASLNYGVPANNELMFFKMA